jgi:hypothetical protein
LYPAAVLVEVVTIVVVAVVVLVNVVTTTSDQSAFVKFTDLSGVLSTGVRFIGAGIVVVAISAIAKTGIVAKIIPKAILKER